MKKIAFVDWWDGFNIYDNFITHALDGKIDYQVIDIGKSEHMGMEVDFVCCSLFGKDALSFKCPRIFYTGENQVPDFNIYDYGIGFDDISFRDRYIRFPLYAACYKDDCQRMLKKEESIGEDCCTRDFCSIVVSNSWAADSYREQLFDLLSEYKFVASGGRYRNNIDKPEGVEDKLLFLNQYKFNVACENVSHRGYCTEKIVQAFAAGTVPIYWGDPDVAKYFNPKAFINCHDYDSIERVVQAVKELNEDEQKYRAMLSAPAIIDENYEIEKMQHDFEDWLLKIVKQNKEDAYRRSLQGRAAIYEKMMLEHDMYVAKCWKKDSWIKRIANFLRD